MLSTLHVGMCCARMTHKYSHYSMCTWKHGTLCPMEGIAVSVFTFNCRLLWDVQWSERALFGLLHLLQQDLPLPQHHPPLRVLLKPYPNDAGHGRCTKDACSL